MKNKELQIIENLKKQIKLLSENYDAMANYEPMHDLYLKLEDKNNYSDEELKEFQKELDVFNNNEIELANLKEELKKYGN